MKAIRIYGHRMQLIFMRGGKDGNYLLFENRFGTLSIDASGLRPASSKDKVSWCLKIVVDGS